MIDFSDIKDTVNEWKNELRSDEYYGHNPILVRIQEDNNQSGIYNGIFNLGYVSGSYMDTVIYGIREIVPEGYKVRYSNLTKEIDCDIKFTVEKCSGYLLENAFDNINQEVWIDINLDVSGNVVTENNKPVSGKMCELVSFQDAIFNSETVFWINKVS